MYYIIVNPASRSGKGADIWSVIEPALIEKGVKYNVFFSRKAGHVITYVRKLSASLSHLKLIVLGGDGTLNEALQGISDFSHVSLGYIPTGSSNDFARDLHLSGDPLQALENILSCKTPRAMDLGCLTYHQFSGESDDSLTRYFAVSCGIGFDAAVCEEALTSKFKRMMNKIGLGKLTYLAIALKQLVKTKKTTCTITLDDTTSLHLPRFMFVACMNHQYEGGGFQFGPGADASDGILDICVIGNIPKWLVLFAFPTAFFGKHFLFPGIDHYRAQKIHLETSAPLWVHTDGEVTRKSSSITVTCNRQQLKLLV